MKRLLTIGCSYSALYYHPDPRYSYTYLLKDMLGYNELINLGTGGLSPTGTFRLLVNYLQNPVVGIPDFIFIQYPSAERTEIFPDYSVVKDNISEENWHLVGRTAFRPGDDLLRDYEKGKRWTNPNWTDETYELSKKDFEDITLITQEIRPFDDYRNGGLHRCPEIVLKCFPSASEEFWSTIEKHPHGPSRDVYYKILSDPRQAAVDYAKHLCLIEKLCENHNIDYAYIDSDYSFVDAKVEIPIHEGFGYPTSSYSAMEYILNNSDNDSIIKYAKNLFSRKNFIHGHNIASLSPTHVDTYPDLHPGKESHRLFAENIAKVLK